MEIGERDWAEFYIYKQGHYFVEWDDAVRYIGINRSSLSRLCKRYDLLEENFTTIYWKNRQLLSVHFVENFRNYLKTKRGY